MNTHLVAALSAEDTSTRLEAALSIGSQPERDQVDALVARCAIEPDFYVRDMLTWALTRFPPEVTVPKLGVWQRLDPMVGSPDLCRVAAIE